MTAHAQRGHARLSPSASKRWMECSGSIRMSEGIRGTSSRFADEGTSAHTLAEHCLQHGFDADRFADMYVNLDGKTAAEKFLAAPSGERCFLVDAEMVDGVQTYLDYVREIMIAPEVECLVEEFVSLEYLGVPGLDGGTADFAAYHIRDGVLDVVDLKYGRGVPVEPQANPQGLSYTLGVVHRFQNRGITKVRITVVQPRCPHPDGPIRTWECDVVDLLDFEADLKAAALRTIEAAAYKGDDKASWSKVYLKPGEWCKFCPAAPTCPARRDQAMSIAMADFDVVGEEIVLPPVASIEPEKLSKLLLDIQQLEDWCRSVKTYAHNEAVHGRCPPGFKLVGNRANRRWKDEAGAIETLEMLGLDQSDYMTEPKLLTPAKVEPLMPGKNKAARAKALADLVTKESSGTVLAPLDDPRPPIKADASEFGEVNE